MKSPELEAVVSHMRAADVLGLPSIAAMREALEAVGAMHPVDPDIECEAANLAGVRGEWLSAPSVSPGRSFSTFIGEAT